jgi:hypothetical protein
MVAGSQRPGGAASNVDYRLRRCAGFRVDSPGRPVWPGRGGAVRIALRSTRHDRRPHRAFRAASAPRFAPGRSQGSSRRRADRPTPRAPTTDRGAPCRICAAALKAWQTGFMRLDAHREVATVINRLRHLIGPRLRRGGEREMTPDVEASAEPSAEEPPAEEQAGEAEPEGPAAEEPSAEEASAEEEPTV